MNKHLFVPWLLLLACVTATGCIDSEDGDGATAGRPRHRRGATSLLGSGMCNGAATTESCAMDCPTSGPSCSDGACGAGESTATCPDDCPGVPSDGSCTSSPDSCTGDNICIQGSYMFGCQSSPLTADELRAGTLDCLGPSGSKFTFRFTAQ